MSCIDIFCIYFRLINILHKNSKVSKLIMFTYIITLLDLQFFILRKYEEEVYAILTRSIKPRNRGYCSKMQLYISEHNQLSKDIFSISRRIARCAVGASNSSPPQYLVD